MARNSEKAVTALARWRNLQLKEQGKVARIERRPYSVQDEADPRRAEKWRNQVIKEVAKKVAQIQNAGLGEFKIRDLNDEINKLLREKSLWEERILELGGPDYRRIGPKLLDKEGKEVPGNKGYKYFGAAKDLPGVKELFEAEAAQSSRKTRAELLRQIDADYYGYIDDEDYLLLAQEEKCEKEARIKKIEEFRENLKQVLGENGQDEMDTEKTIDKAASSEEDAGTFIDKYFEKKEIKNKKVHVQIPSQQEVAQAILDKKKRELLKMYVSEDLIEQENEAKKLAGKI